MAAYSCLSKSSAPLMQMILIFFFKCGWGSVFVLSSTGLYVSNHAEGKLLYRSELAIEVETPRVWNAQKAGRISCPVRGAAEGFWINVINVCMYIFLPFFSPLSSSSSSRWPKAYSAVPGCSLDSLNWVLPVSQCSAAGSELSKWSSSISSEQTQMKAANCTILFFLQLVCINSVQLSVNFTLLAGKKKLCPALTF